jgi:hypothetical protein
VPSLSVLLLVALRYKLIFHFCMFCAPVMIFPDVCLCITFHDSVISLRLHVRFVSSSNGCAFLEFIVSVGQDYCYGQLTMGKFPDIFQIFHLFFSVSLNMY